MLVAFGVLLSSGLAIANAGGLSEPFNFVVGVILTTLPYFLCGLMYRTIVWSAAAGLLISGLLVWMYIELMNTQSSTEGLVFLIYFPMAMLVAALGLAFDHYFDTRKGRRTDL